MRRTVGALLSVPAGLLVAFILGEYELGGTVGVVAGLVVGFALAELTVTVGGSRGVVPAATSAVATAGCLGLAGWIDSTQGVEPFPTGALVGAAAGAVVAVWRALPVTAATFRRA